MSREEKLSLQARVVQMFEHGFNNYMKYAFPYDELRPITCSGMNTWGNYSLTLVDSLDTLYLLNKTDAFREGVNYVINHLRFDTHSNSSVSVFETNIRILGGLLSAHLLLRKEYNFMTLDENQKHSDSLLASKVLAIAQDLADRLLLAFNTPTGIPYGAVNLVHGVAEKESNITSVAGAGTYFMEFGTLSVLTGNCSYIRAAERAAVALYDRRSTTLNLLGNHINIINGQWTHRDAGIGANVDSFYEYLWKGYLLFGIDKLSRMFHVLYNAVISNLLRGEWYFEVDMFTGAITWPLFSSLQAFWPGLQAIIGKDLDLAVKTVKAFHGVWRKYGCIPEGWNVYSASPQPNQRLYPLRPELAESIYHLYRVTRDPMYLYMARDIIKSLSVVARTKCGFATVTDVETHDLTDRMESFFLSETLKYLYLIFSEDHPFHKDQWTFTTEAHLIPLDEVFQTHQCIMHSPLNISEHEEQSEIEKPIGYCNVSERGYFSPLQLGICQLFDKNYL
jgi:mannosidase alpha-like ER degradation enhancer 2